MRTKLTLALIVITTVLVGQSPAGAQRMPGMRGGGMLGGPMMAAYLGLSQDQMSQLKTLRSSQEATIKPLMQELGTYRQQLSQMTESTTELNAQALQNLANEMAQVQAKLTVARTQMEWEIFNKVLTADQQAKLTAMQQQMQQMRQSWRSGHSTAESGANQ
jgi:capsule polysaccharide export protein KpsE/RkpR